MLFQCHNFLVISPPCSLPFSFIDALPHPFPILYLFFSFVFPFISSFISRYQLAIRLSWRFKVLFLTSQLLPSNTVKASSNSPLMHNIISVSIGNFSPIQFLLSLLGLTNLCLFMDLKAWRKLRCDRFFFSCLSLKYSIYRETLGGGLQCQPSFL